MSGMPATRAFLPRDQVVNYDGPDESVECAFPGCTNRLRKADIGDPQYCSKAHRDGKRFRLVPDGECPWCYGWDENSCDHIGRS